MGYEGLDNSQDVANEEKKHPWEVFPEDNSATGENGGKKKNEKTPEQREKEKLKRERRKAKIETAKAWVKENKIFASGAALLILIFIIGTSILVKVIIERHQQSKNLQNDSAITIGGIPDDTTLENAITPDVAFSYALGELSDAANINIITEGSKYISYNKLQDNIDNYIKNLETDYEKTYYRLMSVIVYCLFTDYDRAEYFLTEFEKENHELDNKTRYVYLMAKINYYRAIDDKGKVSEYTEILDREYPEDEGYLDDDTNELITDKDELDRIKKDFEKLQEGEK